MTANLSASNDFKSGLFKILNFGGSGVDPVRIYKVIELVGSNSGTSLHSKFRRGSLLSLHSVFTTTQHIVSNLDSFHLDPVIYKTYCTAGPFHIGWTKLTGTSKCICKVWYDYTGCINRAENFRMGYH